MGEDAQGRTADFPVCCVAGLPACEPSALPACLGLATPCRFVNRRYSRLGSLRYLLTPSPTFIHTPRNLAAGDAELVAEFQLAPELCAGDFAAEEQPIFRDRLRDEVGGFVQEFKAEIPQAEREEVRHKFRAGLRERVVERVATAGVGLEWMLGTDAVAEADVVFVAGAAAVRVVGAGREERAENAVLHVKHRHVLVNRHLEPRGRRAAQQALELPEIQIVRRGKTLELVPTAEVRGGERVGDVE